MYTLTSLREKLGHFYRYLLKIFVNNNAEYRSGSFVITVLSCAVLRFMSTDSKLCQYATNCKILYAV